MSKKSNTSSPADEETTATELEGFSDKENPESKTSESSGMSEPTENAALTKTTEETSAESTLSVEKESSENKVAENQSATVKKATRYGLVRFLQLYPQSSYVEALLRSLYPRAVMTKDEWFNTIDTILNKKVVTGGNYGR